MTLANVEHKYLAGERPSAPLIAAVIEFDGDSSYTTGGTAGFKASVQTALTTAGIKIGTTNTLGVFAIDAKGFQVAYDRTNDKLIIRQCAAAGNPMAEVPAATNLSTTRFCVCVLIK